MSGALGIQAYNPDGSPLVSESVKVHETQHMRDYTLGPLFLAIPWYREARAYRKQLAFLNERIAQLERKENKTDFEQSELDAAKSRRDDIVRLQLNTKEGAQRAVDDARARARQERTQ